MRQQVLPSMCTVVHPLWCKSFVKGLFQTLRKNVVRFILQKISKYRWILSHLLPKPPKPTISLAGSNARKTGWTAKAEVPRWPAQSLDLCSFGLLVLPFSSAWSGANACFQNHSLAAVFSAGLTAKIQVVTARLMPMRANTLHYLERGRRNFRPLCKHFESAKDKSEFD